jgi:hypothetical protein
MAETAEIPEAKDPFEKRIAITIAIIAVILSFVNMKGDNAKTESIIKTNEASNQWAYFQAKSIKQSVTSSELDLLPFLSTAPGAKATDISNVQARLQMEKGRYDLEKEKIKLQAEKLEKSARHDSAVNDRCDHGALFLQLAIVIASVAILTRLHLYWFISMALGAVGTVIGLSAFL